MLTQQFTCILLLFEKYKVAWMAFTECDTLESLQGKKCPAA